MRTIFNLLVFLLVFNCLPAQAQLQDSLRTDWFLLDPEQDHVQGVSAERVYNTLLKDRPSRTVIVAVIDSGIDIDHEDLKDVMWINKDEIAGNGLDDDKNGISTTWEEQDKVLVNTSTSLVEPVKITKSYRLLDITKHNVHIPIPGSCDIYYARTGESLSDFPLLLNKLVDNIHRRYLWIMVLERAPGKEQTVPNKFEDFVFALELEDKPNKLSTIVAALDSICGVDKNRSK